jgi:two-component system cell cycle sensor histidine kinase/response regulator CckA
VLEAGNGTEAIELSERSKKPIDLLLADIAMPGMSGRELAQQLEQLRPGIAVLHMTGFDPVSDDSSGSAPVISFRKPFTGAVLLEKVREVLDARGSKGSKTLRLRKREEP